MVVLKSYSTRFMLMLATAFCPGLEQSCQARDPVSYLDELFNKADAVVLVKVVEATKAVRYSDLNPKHFEEYMVEFEVRSSFKGGLNRGTRATVVAYKSNGRGAPGNFGSTLQLFGKDKRALHLLYLCKRDETWMPASGYIDGGNSHFLVQPSGYVD